MVGQYLQGYMALFKHCLNSDLFRGRAHHICPSSILLHIHTATHMWELSRTTQAQSSTVVH